MLHRSVGQQNGACNRGKPQGNRKGVKCVGTARNWLSKLGYNKLPFMMETFYTFRKLIIFNLNDFY